MAGELVYVSDSGPGIRRVAMRAGFRYVGPGGTGVRCAKCLARIRALAVPPAWVDVWICTEEAGHIQATGRDAKGRKQYRYHAAWHAAQGETKFGQLAAFARALPRIRRRVAEDLAKPGLTRDTVLAAVVRLLDRTHLRVGNEEYARANGSYGLSTLRDKHVRFAGGAVELRFRGKSGVFHTRSVADRRLAQVVRGCRDLPGQELFQYRGADGTPVPVGSADVNGYVREAAGGPFTAKVFRTWAGTVEAATRLAAVPPPTSATAAKRAIVGVVKEVAAVLGNTPAVCRASYVHPAVLTAFTDGTLALNRREASGLSADEAAVARLLRASGRSSSPLPALRERGRGEGAS